MTSDNDRREMVREQAVRDWFSDPATCDVLLTRDGNGRVRVTRRTQEPTLLGRLHIETVIVETGT